MWTLSAVAHEVPFLATAVVLPLLAPVLAVVSVFALGFAWAIPALYAARGAGVLRPATTPAAVRATAAEQRALGLLGDLVGHDARELVARTGLVVERAAFGVWVVGPAGALLVRPGGRRVQCYCVRVADAELPAADRVAHLLLALRADESGFATVANLTFSGACWRLRRRLSPPAREGLAAAVRMAAERVVRGGRDRCVAWAPTWLNDALSRRRWVTASACIGVTGVSRRGRADLYMNMAANSSPTPVSRAPATPRPSSSKAAVAVRRYPAQTHGDASARATPARSATQSRGA